MNIDVNNITKLIPKITDIFKRYKLEFFLVFLVLIFSFLIIQIGRYSTAEPEYQQAQVPKLDEDAIAKIQQLKDQNVEVQSLFEDARNNPFSE